MPTSGEVSNTEQITKAMKKAKPLPSVVWWKEMRMMPAPGAVHSLAREKGWWPERALSAVNMQRVAEKKIPERLCLIHSEVSEGLEGYRVGKIYKGKGCVAEELADVVIRCFDLAAGLGIDIAKEMNKKHKKNQQREQRHGGKKC